MPKSQTGNIDRGLCSRKANHFSQCGNNTCRRCGVKKTNENTSPYFLARNNELCRSCRRALKGSKRYPQVPGQLHTFPCGCSGVLPHKQGQVNKLVVKQGKYWACRARVTLAQSHSHARVGNYKPIDPNTSHAVVRTMVQQDNCILCGESLEWKFGFGTTPHLHHNHATGEIFGFSHMSCNPHAEAKEILRLKTEVENVQQENRQLRQQLESQSVRRAA